jgi:hypothetical protein
MIVDLYGIWRYLIHRLRCDWAFGEGPMALFTPPTSPNIFAGALATSAGDPAAGIILILIFLRLDI